MTDYINLKFKTKDPFKIIVCIEPIGLTNTTNSEHILTVSLDTSGIYQEADFSFTKGHCVLVIASNKQSFMHANELIKHISKYEPNCIYFKSVSCKEPIVFNDELRFNDCFLYLQ